MRLLLATFLLAASGDAQFFRLNLTSAGQDRYRETETGMLFITADCSFVVDHNETLIEYYAEDESRSRIYFNVQGENCRVREIR